MIRVNLLPIKQQKRRSAGRAQLFIFTGLIILEVLVLGLLYLTESSQLEKRNEEVAQSQREVQKAQSEVKDAEQLEKQKQQLTQQLEVLEKLEAKRSGPVRVLDELQAMLSPPRNESDRFNQLQKNWNVEWDSRRLWINSFGEKDGNFNLSGAAVNADDVAEFLQRLSTGVHFYDVELDVVQADNSDAKMVSFKIFGKLDYSGEANEQAAQPEAGKGS